MTKDTIVNAPEAQSSPVTVEQLNVKSVPLTVDGVTYTTDSWTNWGSNLTCHPQKTFHPKTLNDLQVIVREANKNHKKIRCAGSGHSWCAAAVSEEYQVSVTGMNKMHTPVHSETHGWTVKIEPGVLVDELDAFLRKHDPPLAVPSNVLPGCVRYGGMLSMGCHGAALNSRTLSDTVTSMDIVNAKGDLVTYTEAGDSEAFSAACLNLGLLGIIHTATIKVETMQTRLRMMDSYPTLDTVFSGPNAGLDLKAMILRNDSTEFFYWPFKHFGQETFNDEVWVKQWVRTTEPAEAPNAHAGRTPMVDNPFFADFHVGERVLETPEAIHFPFGDGVHTVVDAGVAFKVDDDFSNAVEAFRQLVDTNYLYSTSGPFLYGTALEMRFIKSSDKMLSPAYDKDPEAIYCMLNIMAVSGTPGFEEYTSKVLADWIQRYKAKPHWPKLWESVPDVIPYMRREYGDRLVRFNNIRKEQDPKDMFVNNTFKGLLSDL